MTGVRYGSQRTMRVTRVAVMFAFNVVVWCMRGGWNTVRPFSGTHRVTERGGG